MYIFSGGRFVAEIARPNNIILCDGCNSVITDEKIKCLSFSKDFIHSAQCKNCIEEYFSDFPVEELEE
jgi:hypothetical protein